MVEVFRTNVKDQQDARWLLDLIHRTFREYQANFDLEGCDKILRVKSTTGLVQASLLIDLLKELGVIAEVLSDEVQPVAPLRLTKEKRFLMGVIIERAGNRWCK